MCQVRSIVLATHSDAKAAEIREAMGQLSVRLVGIGEIGDIQEAPETGATCAENARDKAMYYADATGQWCLADDSGLEVDALDGAPGVQSARWAADRYEPGAGRQTIDAANNAKLLGQLSGVGVEDRSARFVCHLALAGPEGVLCETFGTIEGRILESPRGENGFGYDPLFWVDELGCTTAELSRRQKNRISHRGKATRQFVGLLKSLLQHGT